MLRGYYTSISSMLELQARQNVTANNIAIPEVKVNTDDTYWSLSSLNSFSDNWNPPEVNANVATTLIIEYHELNKFTTPISLVDISLVKMGTVIIANPFENNDDSVYTTEDFTPAEIFLFFITIDPLFYFLVFPIVIFLLTKKYSIIFK